MKDIILAAACISFFSLPTFVLAATKPNINPKVSSGASQTVKTHGFKQIKSGDSIYAILHEEGFSKDQVAQVMRHDLPFEKFTLVPGERYRIKSLSSKSKEIKFYLKPSNEVFIIWRENELAGAQLREEKYEVKTKTVSGKVQGSIVASIYAQIPDKWVAYRFMDAYIFDFKLPRVLQKGDAFSLTIEEKYDDGEFIGYGEILETHLEIKGNTESRYFVAFADGGSFISLNGIKSQRPLYSPVNYLRISSGYDPYRKHPIKRKRTPHLGVDFELDEGEDIYSVQSGKVLRTGKNRASGRYVVIRHKGGLESYYNHMKTIEAGIEPGAYVKNGQKIGEIGCTGYCTKPHLHFAIKKAGRFIDPVAYLKTYPYKEKSIIGKRIALLEKDGEKSVLDEL